MNSLTHIDFHIYSNKLNHSLLHILITGVYVYMAYFILRIFLYSRETCHWGNIQLTLGEDYTEPYFHHITYNRINLWYLNLHNDKCTNVDKPSISITSFCLRDSGFFFVFPEDGTARECDRRFRRGTATNRITTQKKTYFRYRLCTSYLPLCA